MVVRYFSRINENVHYYFLLLFSFQYLIHMHKSSLLPGVERGCTTITELYFIF